MRAIRNQDNNNWKIVMIKTIEDRVPIYYRLVNLYTYEIQIIPAYRLLDEVVNNKKNIVNLKLANNKVMITNEDGYESTDEIIKVDEFELDIPNIFEWVIRNNRTDIMSRYDTNKNYFSPSNYKIDPMEKLYWTCENGHTIRCGFPTYFSTNCSCPICNIEKLDEIASFKYWAHITDNLDLLEEYENCDRNTDDSDKISWKSKKKVWFKRNNEEVQESMYNVNVKKMEPPFIENKRTIINLNKSK